MFAIMLIQLKASPQRFLAETSGDIMPTCRARRISSLPPFTVPVAIASAPPSRRGFFSGSAARELGCDVSEERFAETVRKIAKAPPQHRAANQKSAAKKRP
jgi:hypothetical protein